MRRVDRDPNPLADVVQRSTEWMFRLAALGLCMLAAVQGLLMVPQVRVWLLPVERLEGAPVQGAASAGEAEISLSLVGGGEWPDAYVTINGRPVQAFSHAEVRLTVHEGDALQVDATRARGNRRVSIDHDSPRLLTPVAGLEWDVGGGRKSPVVHVHFIAINP
ncbi:MAG: hypothetical protein QJR01_00590 [Kyrpidia sp.]|nr:hypothetical protein [Kyrpidia sp.]